MTEGMLFDIQRNSFVDGPGIRTAVFFKSCNLRCAWCHNPESQNAQPEVLHYPNKTELCGRMYSADEVMAEILKDRRFYAASGGGVTFTGGECMLQPDFLEDLLKQCRKQGIHTAVDTAGNIPFDRFEQILPYTDLFLYDVKLLDSEKHRKYTGASNRLILENLEKLLRLGAKLYIRIPVIPGVNKEEIPTMEKYLSALCPEKIELLPYHRLGEDKYLALGRKKPNFNEQNPHPLSDL